MECLLLLFYCLKIQVITEPTTTFILKQLMENGVNIFNNRIVANSMTKLQDIFDLKHVSFTKECITEIQNKQCEFPYG
jgi:hypothetical protein